MSRTTTVRRTVAAALVLAGAVGMSACSASSDAAAPAASSTSVTSSAAGTATSSAAGTTTSAGAGAAAQPATGTTAAGSGGTAAAPAGGAKAGDLSKVMPTGPLAGYTCDIARQLPHGRQVWVNGSGSRAVTLPFDPGMVTQIDDRSGDAVDRLLAFDSSKKLHFLEVTGTAVTHDAVIGEGYGWVRNMAAGLPGGGAKGTLVLLSQTGVMDARDLIPAPGGPKAGLTVGEWSGSNLPGPEHIAGIGTWGDNGFHVAVMTSQGITLNDPVRPGRTSALEITGGLPAQPAVLRHVECAKDGRVQPAVAVFESDGRWSPVSGALYAYTGRTSLTKVADLKG